MDGVAEAGFGLASPHLSHFLRCKMRHTGDALLYLRQVCLMKTSMRNIAAAIGIILVVSGVRASASDDMLIYSSVTSILTKKTLYNGWQIEDDNATISYTNTTPVHSGTYSISVVMTNTGGAVDFAVAQPDNNDKSSAYSPVDTSIYTNLVFWANGGPTGGQMFTVYGALDGNDQPKVTNGPLAANTWTNITISLSALGLANKTNLNHIFIHSYPSEANEPLFYLDDVSLVAAPPPAVVNVGVNAANVVNKVDARLFGLNTAAYNGGLGTAQTQSNLNGMNIQTLRWPGGAYADTFHFKPGNFPKADTFIDAVSNTQAKVFFTANYHTGDTNEAAGWVSYFNITNHLQCYCKYWEIGNEVYLTNRELEDDNTNLVDFGQEVAHDPWTYAMLFKDYYHAMKAVDTNIMIGAVAEPNFDLDINNRNHPAYDSFTQKTNYGWTSVMLNTMSNIGVAPDFLIEHKYALEVGDIYNLVSWNTTWASDAAKLRQLLNDYLGTNAAANVDLVATEFGTVGGKQDVSLVGGLYYCDTIGQVMQTQNGFNALMYWELSAGELTITNPDPTIYGWRTNSDGVYVTSEGCVRDGDDPPYYCYPTFYCMKLMQYFARGGDTVVRATSDYDLLGTYAVRRTNGLLTLLVINKSSTYSLTANINLQGFPIASNTTALTYSYGMPQDNANEFGIGSPDIAQTNFSGAGPSFSYTFAPYSATVLSFPPSAPALVVPPVTPPPGQFVFQLQGLSGIPYVIQVSTNLAATNWTAISTNMTPSGTMYVTNTMSSAAQFYRAIWQP